MASFILSLDPGEYWVLVLVAGLGGLVAFVLGFLWLRHARVMEDTPTARIRSAAQGYVELEGRARVMDGPPIFAPLTKGSCCWWRYCIERRERDADGKGYHWDTIESDVSGELFELVDDTGQCVINPHGAKVVPGVRHVWYGSSLRPGVGPKIGKGWLRAMSGNYRYTEEILEPNSPLYAIGHFRTQGGSEAIGSLEVDVRDLLAKWKRDPKMMKLLDVNRDGRVDEREWEAARQMAHTQALREAAQAPPAADVHVLGKPPDRRPFVLSAMSQAKLIRREKLRAFAALALAIAGGALCTYALEVRGFV